MSRRSSTRLWRSVRDLRGERNAAGDPKREFPGDPGVRDLEMSRRSFLKLVGAQAMMSCLAGCARRVETIIPYAKSPEEIVPGKPLYFASVVSFDGFGRGVLVESHMGRPTKIEGNPGHPDSLGSTDPITQALVYQLYDPDRLHGLRLNGGPASWDRFVAELRARMEKARGRGGKGVHFLSRPIVSPGLAFARRALLREYPRAAWHQWSPINRDPAREAFVAAYGRDLQPVYRLANADVILSVESDFLVRGPGAMAYARAFADRRAAARASGVMPRLYALESTPTLTGAMADHRMICHPSGIEPFLRALADLVRGRPAKGGGLSTRRRGELEALAGDLRSAGPRALVVAGEEQSAEAHILACRLNDLLGGTGSTVEYLEPVEEAPESCAESIRALARALEGGGVTELVILDGNPAYASPRDLGLSAKIPRAGFRVYLGLYDDETAHLSQWVVPLAHELESWGDARAFDGTISIRQPLIEPLFGGVTEIELCLACLRRELPPREEVVKGIWREQARGRDFDALWHAALRDGVMPGTARAPVRVRAAKRPALPPAGPVSDRWTLLIRPDPCVLDGRFSNTSWLQELPKPLTKLTWGNAAIISPESAAEAGVRDGDLIEIETGSGSAVAPVCVLPGQAPRVMTVHTGYGRAHAGGNGGGYGFDAFSLAGISRPHRTEEFRFARRGGSVPLATTQHHGMLRGKRQLIPVADLKEYRRDPSFARRLVRSPGRAETLYRPGEHLHGDYQWAMVIDLNRCTGCGACTMACQVENNIAAVGREQVLRNREMHWIRVDRYYKGAPGEPEIYHQPMPCMHCCDAPCELVCPVAATNHSSEGLNLMVYNRCIGTRYCSNNCPYKVRRFNFFEYNGFASKVSAQHENPDVTIRSRGVMEKCTYCVQRINQARIAAGKEGRAIRDGEILTACQQVCPTQAISFGDARDPDSRVARLKADPLNYELLGPLGTRPRTSYLARVRNPNPRGAAAGDGGGG